MLGYFSCIDYISAFFHTNREGSKLLSSLSQKVSSHTGNQAGVQSSREQASNRSIRHQPLLHSLLKGFHNELIKLNVLLMQIDLRLSGILLNFKDLILVIRGSVSSPQKSSLIQPLNFRTEVRKPSKKTTDSKLMFIGEIECRPYT